MKKWIPAAASVLALLFLAGCGNTAEKTASAEPSAAPTATPCPVKIGLYGATSVTVVTGPDMTEEIGPDGDILCLHGSGDGSLTHNGETVPMEWTCSGEDFKMVMNGGTYTGTAEQGGTVITMEMADGTHVFTFGAEDPEDGEENGSDADEDEADDGSGADDESEDESEDAQSTPDPEDGFIFDAYEPTVQEDDTPVEDYITLGSYGAVSCRDENGSDRSIDGDLIILSSADTSPAEDILVSGKGTFQRWDEFILFRFDLNKDGTFTGYWCWSGPEEFKGDFMQEIITGTYDGTTLAVTLDGLQYEFVLDETPQQADDYQYTAGNHYGDSFAVVWD